MEVTFFPVVYSHFKDFCYAFFFAFFFVAFFAFFCIFLSRDDENPCRVNYFRSTAWARHTFTTHTTLNTEQNQLAIKVSADN